jgi:hypothetical protein
MEDVRFDCQVAVDKTRRIGIVAEMPPILRRQKQSRRNAGFGVGDIEAKAVIL